MSLKIKLPPVFKINEHWKGNTIQQMVEPGSIVDGEVANYTSGKLKGKVITTSVDGVQILILEKPSSSPLHFFGTIKARQATSASANGAWNLGNAEWMSHPKLSGSSGENPNYAQHLADIVESWQGAFSYLAENQNKGINGLRLPQIGAVHAIHAHWAVSNEPATIVMPTGTGKTETMLAVLVSAQCNKTLVVVPTDVLRTQIAEKSLTLGVLKEFGVVSAEALLPVVGILKHKPKDAAEVDAFFEKCCVIVTTSHIAGQCTDEVQERFATHCDFLFIDEAHHIAAPTWSGLKARFSSRRILQFTATPFREDDKEVEGRIIFKYPLRKDPVQIHTGIAKKEREVIRRKTGAR